MNFFARMQSTGNGGAVRRNVHGCFYDRPVDIDRSHSRYETVSRWPVPFASLISLVLVSVPVHAQFLECGELQQVLDEAGTNFSALVGEVLETETEEALASKQGIPVEMMTMSYERNVATATLTFSGAATCEVVSVQTEDDKSSVSSASFDCHYPGVFEVSGARAVVEKCVGRQASPDSDKENASIPIDSVVSGEGFRNTAVELDANMVDGLGLHVRLSVCLNNTEGACDDKWEDELE